jgi:Patatin-like phospholipase
LKNILVFLITALPLSGCIATSSESNVSRTLARNISNYTDTQREQIRKNDLGFLQKNQLVADCSATRDSGGDECLYAKERDYLRNHQKKWPPELGLALSGGGTRAASFAIGVLKALHENGTLEKVDVISSVSGGSYAAYWYFSQIFYMDALLKACKNLEQNKEFQTFCNESLNHTRQEEVANQQGDASRYRAEAEIFRTWGESQTNIDEPNQYRFQRTLEESSKILAFAHKPSFTKGTVAGLQYGVETLIQGFSIPIHWLANGLFDWETNITPFFYFYKDGLERTYGYAPLDYTLEHFANANAIWFNRIQNIDAEPISMGEAAKFLEDKDKSRLISNAQRLPYFVINTTARYGRLIKRYGRGKEKTVEDSVFEFTPWGCHSSLLDIKNARDQVNFCPKDFNLEWPPRWQELDLARLVTISGGAVDGQAAFVDIAGREEVPYSILGRKWCTRLHSTWATSTWAISFRIKRHLSGSGCFTRYCLGRYTTYMTTRWETTLPVFISLMEAIRKTLGFYLWCEEA